jgi:hypothetical protein
LLRRQNRFEPVHAEDMTHELRTIAVRGRTGAEQCAGSRC